MSAFSRDDHINYMISEIMLKSCDMNKIAVFCDEFEKIKTDFEVLIGSEESQFLEALMDDIKHHETELRRLKSIVWDEVFYEHKKTTFSALEEAFASLIESPSKTFLEIKELSVALDRLYQKKSTFKAMCEKLQDLMGDVSHFVSRECHVASTCGNNADIHIPKILKLPANTHLYDDATNTCSIRVLDSINKTREYLIETLNVINTDLILAKSSTYDVLCENSTHERGEKTI